jgi:hypothetical protein
MQQQAQQAQQAQAQQQAQPQPLRPSVRRVPSGVSLASLGGFGTATASGGLVATW